MTDLTDYKTASRLSPYINAGASARLSLQPLVTSLTGEAGQAFAHGWRTTDVAENKAGRPMPGFEGILPYEHHAMEWKTIRRAQDDGSAVTATSMVGG